MALRLLEWSGRSPPQVANNLTGFSVLERASYTAPQGPFPGQNPPKRATKRPARPYKSATQNRFTIENDEGA
jgi:hypothetical protein